MDINIGTVLRKEDLFPVRPIKEDALPPYELKNIVGKILNKDVKKDNYIKWEDIV